MSNEKKIPGSILKKAVRLAKQNGRPRAIVNVRLSDSFLICQTEGDYIMSEEFRQGEGVLLAMVFPDGRVEY